MTEAAMLGSEVGAALSVQAMLDAWEDDRPPPENHLPPEKAQRLEMLVQLAVQMATGLKLAWRMCIQGGSGWEAGLYMRRMQAVEFLARIVVDILTRTHENVERTRVTHPNWVAPRELAAVQSNLPAASEILARAQELLAQSNRQRPRVNEVSGESSPASTVADKFHELASRWKRETQFCSSRTKMVDHPAYQEIIGMGREVLPLILEELKTDPRYWFPALHAITREDPVPAKDRGIVRKMADAWLQWGKAHGF